MLHPNKALIRKTHYAVGVGLTHGVGVTEGKPSTLCCGRLTKRLEQAATLLLGWLTKQTTCAGAKSTSGRCGKET